MDWNSITALGIIWSLINPMDKTKLKYLEILITEPWWDIISGYKATSEILNKKNTGSIDGINNNSHNKNAYAKTSFSIYNITNRNTNMNMYDTGSIRDTGNIDMGDTSNTGDIYSISGANNNVDDKNTYAKAGFSTYNIASANAGMGTSDTSGIADANNTGMGNTTSIKDNGSTSSVDNNANNKNAYAKIYFTTYNVSNTSANDTSGTGEKICNNKKNTDAS